MGKGDQTRQTILDTAVRLARYHGLSGLSIGAVAASADMSKSGVWAHFKSKEALQLACMERNGVEFINQVIRPSLAAPRGIRRLESLVQHWMNWYSRPGGCLFLATANEFDDLDGPLNDRMVADQKDLLDCISQIVTTAVTEGEFASTTDPIQIGQEVFGILMTYNWTHRILEFPDADKRTWTALNRLIDSLRA
ncbi:TetR/AcrR family transcriptional regulator [Haloglycomyces albus]|uniref:TetR/AcrR family transcriptional regulator n=1 Tax=Haloglycomyces albus TaxID=526067 RepID=UPI00046D1401|nr:TetR/AcrR family transcriptional regulator [Haloglycomyces albus]